jgi:hypothetical protein
MLMILLIRIVTGMVERPTHIEGPAISTLQALLKFEVSSFS